MGRYSTSIIQDNNSTPVIRDPFHWIVFTGLLCVFMESAAAHVINKGCFLFFYLLDQIQALVSMNSMLVLLEQAADVVHA